MSLTVHIPDDLARRLEQVAADRKQAPEQVALDAIEAQLPTGRRVSFSGIGASGLRDGSVARRHREVLADAAASKTARDI